MGEKGNIAVAATVSSHHVAKDRVDDKLKQRDKPTG
jgi:hypothetical protein